MDCVRELLGMFWDYIKGLPWSAIITKGLGYLKFALELLELFKDKCKWIQKLDKCSWIDKVVSILADVLVIFEECAKSVIDWLRVGAAAALCIAKVVLYATIQLFPALPKFSKLAEGLYKLAKHGLEALSAINRSDWASLVSHLAKFVQELCAVIEWKVAEPLTKVVEKISARCAELSKEYKKLLAGLDFVKTTGNQLASTDPDPKEVILKSVAFIKILVCKAPDNDK